MNLSGKVVKISGPLVVATGLADANMSDVVRVGPQRLIGEILTMKGDSASIQVYEETSGLGPGAAVETTGAPMSVELGPGIIENIYDGIQRPLEKIVEKVGANITRGVEVPALDRKKKWEFVPTVERGAEVTGGDVLAVHRHHHALPLQCAVGEVADRIALGLLRHRRSHCLHHGLGLRVGRVRGCRPGGVSSRLGTAAPREQAQGHHQAQNQC